MLLTLITLAATKAGGKRHDRVESLYEVMAGGSGKQRLRSHPKQKFYSGKKAGQFGKILTPTEWRIKAWKQKKGRFRQHSG